MERTIVCISDTHNLQNELKIPDGDILIHAGDLTSRGKLTEWGAAAKWLGTLPHKHKIVIAGNHDFYAEFDPLTAGSIMAYQGVEYLFDRAVLVEGIKIYGSPWQPWFYDWAFNVRRGELHKKWKHIPSDCDILVTHGPIAGYCDITAHDGLHVGCEELYQELLRRAQRPQLHVSGHIHEGYGQVYSDELQMTCINASVCTREYKPINAPIIYKYKYKD